MATHNTLNSLFTDIADAIREKTGESGTIVADNFPSAVRGISSTPRLKNISPITENGKYAVATDVILVDGLTTIGNGYFITDISLDGGAIYDTEFEVDLTNYPYSYSSSLYGTKHTSGNNNFRISTNASAINYYGYTHSKCANANALAKPQTLHIKTDFAKSKFYINDVQYTTSNASSTSGASVPLYILAENHGGSKSENFKGVFKYLKIYNAKGTLLYWFVPARNGNNDVLLYDKVNAVKYTATGNGLTLGADLSDESYDGFQTPIQVNVPDKTRWGATIEDMFNDSVPSFPTLHDVVIPEGEMLKSIASLFRYSTIKTFTGYGNTSSASSYFYNYTLANNPYLEDVKLLRGSSTWSYCGTNAWQYFCQQCTNLKHFYCDMLVYNGAGMANALNGCTSLEDVTLIFNTATPTANGNNVFQYFCTGCESLTKILFKYFTSITSGYNQFNYAFRNCYSMFDGDINHFRFPDLEQIGLNSGTSVYACFRYAFYSTGSAYYGKLHILFPEVKYIYNRHTTATNGMFAYNNALGKIYLPKFVADGTTGKNIFNNCAYLTEIHFGIENQATVQALSGYSSKFGATNATIYFDMVNHITVNEVTYDRSGAEYDYDTSHYSWKNGNNVIYTTNAINPAVGDSTYTNSGTTYTFAGTITSIS